MHRFLSVLTSSLAALLVLAAAPAFAGERPGGGGHGGGGHDRGGHGGGGCRGGGCGGGGHYDGNINVNVNATASAFAGAGAGAVINARAYDIRAVSGGYGGGHGGMVAVGSGGVDPGGYGHGGGYGYVHVSGPGYGPSRPFGYAVRGFGRRYVTIDRCGSCELPPAPPPPPCRDRCDGDGHGHGGHGYQGSYGESYGHSSASGSSYSVRESYSESSAYVGGYAAAQGGHEDEDASGYAGYPPASEAYGYAPPEPQVYRPMPDYVTPPTGYYGDLPPGDTGEGMPYRQEYGERG